MAASLFCPLARAHASFATRWPSAGSARTSPRVALAHLREQHQSFRTRPPLPLRSAAALRPVPPAPPASLSALLAAGSLRSLPRCARTSMRCCWPSQCGRCAYHILVLAALAGAQSALAFYFRSEFRKRGLLNRSGCYCRCRAAGLWSAASADSCVVSGLVCEQTRPASGKMLLAEVASEQKLDRCAQCAA